MLVLPTVTALAVERGKAGAGAGPWQTGRMTISDPGRIGQASGGSQ